MSDPNMIAMNNPGNSTAINTYITRSQVVVSEESFNMDDAFVVEDPGATERLDDEFHPTFTAPPTKDGADRSLRRRWFIAMGIIITIVMIILIAVIIILTREGEDDVDNKDEEHRNTSTTTAVDFMTEATSVTFYGINTTITSHLARTVLTMDVSNMLNSSSIRGVMFQLPLAARVVSIQTLSTDDGKEPSRTTQKTLEQARESFLEAVAQGLPAAYMEESSDSSAICSLQVAIPPFGMTRVELVLEEFLKQMVGEEVEFEIPLAPNEKVDQILLDIALLGTSQEGMNGTAFYLENLQLFGSSGPLINATSTYHLYITDPQKYNLPPILHGFFYSLGNLPPSGMLYSDSMWFEDFFNITTESMERAIFVVLDMSESMEQGSKLGDAKDALHSLMDSLYISDTLTIQTFGERGTMDVWGAAHATNVGKAEAKSFVDALETRCCGTNLRDAYQDALVRAKNNPETGGHKAAIVIVLSDGLFCNTIIK